MPLRQRRAFKQTVKVRCSACGRKLREHPRGALWLNHAKRCDRKYLGPDAA